MTPCRRSPAVTARTGRRRGSCTPRRRFLQRMESTSPRRRRRMDELPSRRLPPACAGSPRTNKQGVNCKSNFGNTPKPMCRWGQTPLPLDAVGDRPQLRRLRSLIGARVCRTAPLTRRSSVWYTVVDVEDEIEDSCPWTTVPLTIFRATSRRRHRDGANAPTPGRRPSDFSPWMGCARRDYSSRRRRTTSRGRSRRPRHGGAE